MAFPISSISVGVELGIFIKMLETTPAKTLQQFMTTEFSKVTPKVVKEISEYGNKFCENSECAQS